MAYCFSLRACSKEPLARIFRLQAALEVFYHSVNIRTAGSYRLLSTLLVHFNLVYGLFGQNNMYSKLEFCHRPARNEMNVPLNR